MVSVKRRDLFFYGGAAVFGLIVASYFASVIFFALSGLTIDNAQPWSIWVYLPYFSDPTVKLKLLISMIVPHIVLGLMAISMLRKPPSEYGDAHWASASEIEDAGLFSSTGLILGKFKNRFLISSSPTHCMVIAPTRSGKGVGIVTPNLLNWPESVICLDIKLENYKNTAGFRESHGHEIFMWAPGDKEGKSHRYNPLAAISDDPFQKISDIQVIANILIRDPVKSDPVWASEARALFVGLALYVVENEEMPSTIGAINRLLGTEQDLGDICKHIVKKHPELSVTIKKSLLNFANKAAKERSGVKSSLNQAINLWDNPLIDAVTSASDFSLSDLRKKRMAVYVGVRTGQIGTLAPLLRIFFEQVITTLSMKEPDASDPHHVLLLLDEMHMLGEMDSMTKAFTLLAGYNCRVLGIVQGLSWLDTTYGKQKRDGILSCCAHQVFFATNDLETSEYISRSCGERTIKTVSTSQKSGWKYETPSKNTSYRGRPLMSRDQVKQLPYNKAVILVESSVPILATKIQYYGDTAFKTRILPAPPVPKLEIAHHNIPIFNIPQDDQEKPTKPDPNQLDIFTKPERRKVPTNLTDHLKDTPPEFDDGEYDDSILAALKDAFQD